MPHGGATQVVLSDTAYQEIFENNPNAVLLSQLAENGVSLFVCAQATVGRSDLLDQLYPSVRLALSVLNVSLIIKKGSSWYCKTKNHLHESHIKETDLPHNCNTKNVPVRLPKKRKSLLKFMYAV